MEQISIQFSKKAKQDVNTLMFYQKFLNFNVTLITFSGTYFEKKYIDKNDTKQKILSLTITKCTRTLNKLDNRIIN